MRGEAQEEEARVEKHVARLLEDARRLCSDHSSSVKSECGGMLKNAEFLRTLNLERLLGHLLENEFVTHIDIGRGFSATTIPSIQLQRSPSLRNYALLQLRVTARVMSATSARPIVTLYEMQKEICAAEGAQTYEALCLGPSLLNLPAVQWIFRVNPSMSIVPATSEAFLSFVRFDRRAQELIVAKAGVGPLVDLFASTLGHKRGRYCGLHIQNFDWLLHFVRLENARAEHHFRRHLQDLHVRRSELIGPYAELAVQLDTQLDFLKQTKKCRRKGSPCEASADATVADSTVLDLSLPPQLQQIIASTSACFSHDEPLVLRVVPMKEAESSLHSTLRTADASLKSHAAVPEGTCSNHEATATTAEAPTKILVSATQVTPRSTFAPSGRRGRIVTAPKMLAHPMQPPQLGDGIFQSQLLNSLLSASASCSGPAGGVLQELPPRSRIRALITKQLLSQDEAMRTNCLTDALAEAVVEMCSMTIGNKRDASHQQIDLRSRVDVMPTKQPAELFAAHLSAVAKIARAAHQNDGAIPDGLSLYDSAACEVHSLRSVPMYFGEQYAADVGLQAKFFGAIGGHVLLLHPMYAELARTVPMAPANLIAFLQRCGVRTNFEIVPVAPRTPAETEDFDCPALLKTITSIIARNDADGVRFPQSASGKAERLCAILHILNASWLEHFHPSARCGSSKSSAPSKYIRDLRATQWIPVASSSAFKAPQSVFLPNKTNLSLFREYAWFMAGVPSCPESSQRISVDQWCSTMIEDLGIVARPTVDCVVRKLEEFAQLGPSFKTNAAHMESIYEFLAYQCLTCGDTRAQNILRHKSVVFCPLGSSQRTFIQELGDTAAKSSAAACPEFLNSHGHCSGTFHKQHEVFWDIGREDDSRGDILPLLLLRLSLSVHYAAAPQLADFFVRILGVSEKPTFSSWIAAIRHECASVSHCLPSKPFTAAIQGYHEVSLRLLCWLHEDDEVSAGKDALGAEEFEAKIFAQRCGWWTLRDRICVGFGSVVNGFANRSGELPILPLSQMPDEKFIRFLQRNLHFRSFAEEILTEVGVDAFCPSATSQLHSAITKVVPYVQRFLRDSFPQIYLEQNRSVSEVLAHVEVHVCRSPCLIVEHNEDSLKQPISVHYNKQTNELVVSENCASTHLIAPAIARMFFTALNVEAYNALTQLLCELLAADSDGERESVLALHSRGAAHATFKETDPLWSMPPAPPQKMYNVFPYGTDPLQLTASVAGSSTRVAAHQIQGHQAFHKQIHPPEQEILVPDVGSTVEVPVDEPVAPLKLRRIERSDGIATGNDTSNLDFDSAKYARIAEEYVAATLREQLKGSHGASVIWVNQNGESGLPYDVLVHVTDQTTGQKRVTKYVEVKSTCSTDRRVFEMTLREFLFAAKYGPFYTIYRVFNAPNIVDDDANRKTGPLRLQGASQRRIRVEHYDDPIGMWSRGAMAASGNVRLTVL